MAWLLDLRASRAAPRLDLVALGLATALAQIIILREAMALLGGSEISWGLVLGLWLIGVSLGARIGIHVDSLGIARKLTITILALAAFATLMIRAAPALIGSGPGESPSLAAVSALWLIAIIPASLTGGLCFPVMAEALKSSGNAYSWESIGTLIGGAVFTAFLAPLGSATSVLTGLVLTTILLRARPYIVVVLIVLVLASASTLERGLAQIDWRCSHRPGELAFSAETRHQRIQSSTGPVTAVYTNGRLRATYPDHYSSVSRAHLSMLLHPQPARVLAINSLVDASFMTMLQHPVEQLYLAEEDPALPNLLHDAYDQSFRDSLQQSPVMIIRGDPVRQLPNNLDVILISGSLPSTFRHNRLWTREFYQICRDHLNHDGFLVAGLTVSDTYLGGLSGELLETVGATLAAVFDEVTAIPGNPVLLIAGAQRPHLDRLAERYQSRAIADPLFAPEIIPVLLDEDRQGALTRWLAESKAEPNTAAHPRAVLPASGLVESIHALPLAKLAYRTASISPVWLAGVFVTLIGAILIVPTCRGRDAVITTASMVIGASSLSWWIMLLLVWQGCRGSVYAEVGLLTAIFMTGLALGSRSTASTPRQAALVLAAGALLSVLIAAGLPWHVPMLSTPLMLVAGGFLTGVSYSCMADLRDARSVRRASSIIFAADEFGASIAALTIGTLVIPLYGMATAATALAILQIAILLPLLVTTIRSPTS